MLKSRSSGGRLVRSNPQRNTKSASRPRSMHASGAVNSTPRKFQFGTGRRGVSYGPSGPPGGALSPFGTRGKIPVMDPQDQGDCRNGEHQWDGGCWREGILQCCQGPGCANRCDEGCCSPSA
jgi:hypothetical protein